MIEISPKEFSDLNLKGKNEKQIMVEIRKLRKEIEELKIIIEDPSYKDIIHAKPDEYTRISMNRLYLQEAKKALEAIGGTYKKSRVEIKDERFNENISNISTITFTYGGYFLGRDKYVIHLKDNRITIQKYDFETLIEEKEIDKVEWMDEFKILHIGEWNSNYDCLDILDGIQWNLEIIYLNGKKKNFYGSNQYPYNFHDFLYLLKTEDFNWHNCKFFYNKSNYR